MDAAVLGIVVPSAATLLLGLLGWAVNRQSAHRASENEEQRLDLDRLRAIADRQDQVIAQRDAEIARKDAEIIRLRGVITRLEEP